jgi:hypothetical protein
MRTGFRQSHWVALKIGGLVGSPVRVDVVGVEVGAVEEAPIDGVRVASAVVFEGRFSEVSGEGAVRDPPCGLFELHINPYTFSMSFSCSS